MRTTPTIEAAVRSAFLPKFPPHRVGKQQFPQASPTSDANIWAHLDMTKGGGRRTR
jgi:hypothetical protein